MDGIIAVQSRIAQIQSQFAAVGAGNWTSAASAAGTMNPSAVAFADALKNAGNAQGATGSTALGPGGQAAGSAEQQVVAQARKYLGVPYVWGGTNPEVGLDCSGFTQRVYANLGYDIPRVSYEQAKAGRPVASVAEARPGDLVFYDYSSSRPGIDHVGLYIGNGKMINAPKPGDVVKISDVGNPVAIRRILPPASETGAPAAASRVGAGNGLAGVPYADLFARAGAKHGIPATLLAAVARTESAFNPRAVSPAGAQGLMQFMPGTARDMGINPLVPAEAVDGAARYLAQNLRTFGSVNLALAAYNAGPGAVQKYNGIPPYPETQQYIRKVNQAWEEYR